MKSRTLLSLITLFILLPAFTITAQKADISGEWKLNKEKSQVAENLFLSRITLKLKPDSLLTTRVYENQNGEEYTFDENLTLDNKECKIVIYEMPRTSSATRSDADETISIASTTTFNGNNGMEDMVAKEAWKLGDDGNLTLEFTNKMSGNELTGKYLYDKIK
jgi:hypothetical protein